MSTLIGSALHALLRNSVCSDRDSSLFRVRVLVTMIDVLVHSFNLVPWPVCPVSWRVHLITNGPKLFLQFAIQCQLPSEQFGAGL
jgi:hypothetical protein